MKLPFRKNAASTADLSQGRVRVDTRTKNLTKRLQPGEIAVINHGDLDRVAAEALVECQVRAVLNASPSVSGRYPNLGPDVLLDNGIVLIDGLGPDIMTLHEGSQIRIEEDGQVFSKSGKLIAQGTLQTKESVAQLMDQARQGLSHQLEAFAANTMDYMKQERDLLLNDVGMPELRTNFSGKHVLVVVRGYSYKEDLKALRSYIREYRPIIIGVDGGADAVMEIGFKPDLVVGDMDSVSDKALKSGAEIIVHAYRDGRAPGLSRVEELGVEHTVFAATGTSEDIAMLIADSGGAQLIVAVGTHVTLLEFLDKGREGMSSTFLTRLKVGSKLIDAKGVSQIYHTRVSNWQIILLALAGLLAIFAALYSTPAGQTLLGLLAAGIDDMVDTVRSWVGLRPTTPNI